MPIYEYRCADCGKKTTVVTLSIGAAVNAVCSHCGGRNMAKLVSRVAVWRSGESGPGELADPSSLAGLEGSDPRSVARWMKRMGREMGEEAGEDFDDEVDKAMEEAERQEGTGEGEDFGGGGGEDL